jgi:hypothetical protein
MVMSQARPRLRLALVLLAGPMFAQSLSFGVKGGVPLTDAFSTARRDPISYSSVTRRYTVGPIAEIGLPLFGLRVEADALYHRIGWDSSRSATPLLEPFQSTVRIGAWDFDALLKHRLGGAGVHPYVGAGAAFRRFFTTRENYVLPAPPPRYLSNQMIGEVQHKNIAGLVSSAGVEFGGAMRIAPEFRYTRWLMNNIWDRYPYPNLSTQSNQAEILVSFTFGRH